MKVSGKDYPIYYGKWKMFETTSQSTLNDSIVDDSRLFNLFGGVRDSFLVQPLWFSTNHGSTHLLHQRPTHDTNECDKIGYIPPKIIKNYLANLGYPAQSSIFSHLVYFIFLSISPLTERASNSIKLTYSRFSQQIYINLWLHQYFIFSLTGASLRCHSSTESWDMAWPRDPRAPRDTGRRSHQGIMFGEHGRTQAGHQ